VSRASHYLNPNAKGGAHADVLAISPEMLAAELSGLPGRNGQSLSRGVAERAADAVGQRFLLKRGKIEDFEMQVVGSSVNKLPRALVSYAFGPFGYNLAPTVEKVLVDSHEACREIPYFGFGERSRVLAPDILAWLGGTVARGRLPGPLAPPEDDLFLSFVDEVGGDHLRMSLYDVLSGDPYFKGKVGSYDELVDYQRFVRRNPLTRNMEELLSSFFQAPITVGVRDTVRWALGSRHPDIGWDKARETIFRCFDQHGEESFLPVEVCYYAVDQGLSATDLAGLLEHNERVVTGFAADLEGALAGKGFLNVERPVLVRLARQVLDFHHGYPLFELEPYQGVLSISTLKLAVRIATAFGLLFSKLPLRERENNNLHSLERRPGEVLSFLTSLDQEERTLLLQALEVSLRRYVQGKGMPAAGGGRLRFRRVPRTFFSFQERADHPCRVKGTVEDMFTLEKLHEPPCRDLLTSLPELAEKLTVFFTLVHRYYKDTSFVPDLRPSNAGRDILLLGIWGYVSENLLITLWRDGKGERHADLSFVDNKDQFKEYRRSEDRRAPLGVAKHALRLTGSLVEPAMLRSIGLFAELAEANSRGSAPSRLPVADKFAAKGLDILQEVIHSGIEQFFDNSKSTIEDVVDDFFAGVQKVIGPKG